jgi:hypothetical protein
MCVCVCVSVGVVCFSRIHLKERDHSENIGIDRRMLLKWIKEAEFGGNKHLAQERDQRR